MPQDISADDAQYTFNLIKRICTEVGPGIPASSQERARANVIKEELASHLGTGQVAMEEFSLAPGAFLGALPLSALLLLAAVLLNISIQQYTGISTWITTIGAFIFSLGAILVFVFEFIQYRELIDPLFIKGQSVNVIGTLRKPEATKVKRLLIISGHHDSAPENIWLRYLGIGMIFLSVIWFIALITVLIMSLIQLTGVITGNADITRFGTMGWVVLTFLITPALIYALFFTRHEKNGGSVPGAVDNLSACALAVTICRFLVRNPDLIPDEMEIRFITFGSEEAGLRGSRRYVECHLDELKNLDTRVLNIEMAAHPEIAILTTDVNNSVKNSPEMIKSVADAAERAGVPHVVKPYPPGSGGSDAGSFTQAGIKALTLLPFKMPEQMVAFYHQKWDSPEVLSVEPLLNVLKLALEWVRAGGE